jgi:PhnB protein
MNTQLIPYLNFNGKCREAMNFYQQCLGGELELQKIAESPMAAQMPSEMGAQILHSSLVNEKLTVMGSDCLGKALISGNNVKLCLNCQTEEEINAFFTRLSEGGIVQMPLHQSFWGATFGEVTDKYGISWMLNYSKG